MSDGSSPLVGASVGYLTGILNGKGLAQYTQYAQSAGLAADSFADGVKGYNAVKFGVVGVLYGAYSDGVVGASNALFSAAVGGVFGPEAGLAYGLLLDYLSKYSSQLNLGGELYEYLHPDELKKLRDATNNIPKNLPLPPGDANNNGIPDIHESKFNPNKVKTPWDNSNVIRQRVDPLTFDLNGDGLSTIGISSTNPILFDHDGDGTKNGTGWIKPDDAFLVRDINGNGTIDNGRELFGDNTLLTTGARAGQKAQDGFDALADLDSNTDGIVNSNDTAYNSLKLWRDLNQDGISQSNELFTLASQNIIGIKVTSTQHSQVLSNGNQLADTGSFIKADGSQGMVGEVTGNLGDVNLATDTFHRSFANVLDTSTVATLPDMQGSGVVRDLREAATQSTRLKTLLTQYAATTAATGQLAQIDQLLDAWADTGGLAETMAVRVANMTGYTKADGTVIPYTLSSNLSAEWQQKLHIIESFNGAYFFGLPNTTQTKGAVTGLTIATPNASSTSVQITANLNQQQLDLLEQSYLQKSDEATRSSVDDGVLNSLRMQPKTKRLHHFKHGSKVWCAFARKRFIQALTAQASVTRHFAHPLSTRNVTQCLSNKSRIAIALLNTSIQVQCHFLRGCQMLCHIKLTKSSVHHLFSNLMFNPFHSYFLASLISCT